MITRQQIEFAFHAVGTLSGGLRMFGVEPAATDAAVQKFATFEERNAALEAEMAPILEHLIEVAKPDCAKLMAIYQKYGGFK